MGIYDVPAAMLIEETAKDLKARVKQPAFVPYVKTGAHRERAPNNPDWYFIRAASILYRIYREGEVGTGALRSYYGGRKNRGVRPEHKVKASGKIIRSALQALEKEGLVKKGKKGRAISPKGEKFLFEKARAAEVLFKSITEKDQAALAERLVKAAQQRQKEKEARIAAEAAKKLAEQKALAAAQAKMAAAAPKPEGQKPVTDQKTTAPDSRTAVTGTNGTIDAKTIVTGTKTGHEQKPVAADKPKEKKDFAPAG